MGDVSASLAEGAARVFSNESDPALAADAMPFALKTLDMLALQQPDNADIHIAAARAYIVYSGAFLDWEARKLEFVDVEKAEQLKKRAARLHFRGRDYAAAALNLRHTDGMSRLMENPDAFLITCDRADVPVLFWLASGWAAGIASDPSNMREFAQIGLIESIMRRCLALDPDYDDGSIHEFFMVFESTRSAAAGGSVDAARAYYDKALTASRNQRASPHVVMATAVMIPTQDLAGFRTLLQQALAVNIDDYPGQRLANSIAQDKARWYLDHIDLFFLTDETTETP